MFALLTVLSCAAVQSPAPPQCSSTLLSMKHYQVVQISSSLRKQPQKALKNCPCSPACTCGCNEGLECTCGCNKKDVQILPPTIKNESSYLPVMPGYTQPFSIGIAQAIPYRAMQAYYQQPTYNYSMRSSGGC